MRTEGGFVLAVVACVLGVCALGASASSSAAVPPKVTVIGDSIMTSVQWYNASAAILEQNLDVDMEVAVCRRLAAPSCPFDGATPPNLLELVSSLGPRIGPTAVVVMGYNDSEATFAKSVEESIQALIHAGVTRIVWPTLRAARHPYVTMNAVLEAAAERHPQLTVPDWNAYSRNHPDWFQNDGIHLFPSGGTALATFLHAAILKALAKPTPILLAPDPLPRGHVDRTYTVHLSASGGTAPYRYRVKGLPAGLAVKGARIVGRPKHTAHVRLSIAVVDATGRAATRTDALVVTR